MFNEQQLECINSDHPRILCLAGAGAGKTSVMIERTRHLVEDLHVPAASILALTFTNAAALEMKTRFISKFPNLQCPEFRTFHSFCYCIIIKDISVRNAIGYTEVPSICTDAELKRIKTEVKLKLGTKLSDEQLSNPNSLNRRERDEYELYMKGVKKALKKDNLITFDIMCYEVADLFVKNDTCSHRYKTQYKYIACDEFQDTDVRQFRFLGSFSQSNFMLVGDARQSIYQWRGCTNDPLKQLSKNKDWLTIKMYENYRSSQQIVEYANNIIKNTDEDYKILMHGQFDGDKVDVQYGSMSSFYEPVDTGHIKDLITKLKKAEGTTAVLCRSNREVKFLSSYLKEADIHYKQNNPEDYSLNMLKSAADDQYMLDWLSTFLLADRYAEFIKLSTQVENPDIRWFASTYKDVPTIKKYGKTIVDIRKIFKQLDALKISGVDAVTSILKLLDRESLAESIDLIKADQLVCYQDLCSYMTELLNEHEEVSCYVGTIHSVKGLEYDNVFVLGVNDFLFQLDTEEMVNLYYVAVTRAKHHLTVYRR